MKSIRPARLATTALVLAALCAGPSPVTAAASSSGDADPWSALDAVRRSLAAAGPEQARFVQTYVPAGFSSGEAEEGRLALLVPDCLRWDYQEPYPKSFLLCGEIAHAWNADDRRGQRMRVDRAEQPGLDLLLLPTAQLTDRYQARGRRASGDRLEVHLTPKRGAPTTELTEATFVIDTASHRLVAVSYRDREGNRTRFEISGYRSLADRNLFAPPRNVDWEQR